MADEESEEIQKDCITVDDLKSEITKQDYETLTLGDDTVAVRCLLKAKIIIKGMVISTGNVYDEQNEACKLATLKCALYELYAYCGQEVKAREKQEDYELIIKTYFGNILTKNDASQDNGPAVGVISNSRKNPLSRGSDTWE